MRGGPPLFRHFRDAFAPNIAGDSGEIRGVAGDSPAHGRISGHDTIASRSRPQRPLRACRLVPTDRRCRGSARDRRAVAVPDRRPHGAFDQGRHGDAASRITRIFFQAVRNSCATRRGDPHRDRATMKTPVVLVDRDADGSDPAGSLTPDRHGNARRKRALAADRPCGGLDCAGVAGAK